MRNFQDTFETRNRSFVGTFPSCMAVPLNFPYFLWFLQIFFYFIILIMKFKSRTSKEILIKVDARKLKWRKGDAACSQIVKHSREQRRVSNTRQKKSWVKQWMADVFSLYLYFSLCLRVFFFFLSRFEFLFLCMKFLFNWDAGLCFVSLSSFFRNNAFI